MGPQLSIVLADDDPDDHEFFSIALSAVTSEDQDFASVYNGRQLLDYLMLRGEFQKDNHPRPDFVVLDLNMPFTDGFSVLKQIKSDASLKDIAVFILTVSHRPEDKKLCGRLGCQGYFVKPTRVSELRGMVQEMIRVHRAERKAG